MRQAIETKYLGPTNHRGSRVRASAQAGSIIVGWDDGLSVDENHAMAARKLAEKYGWTGRFVVGGLPSGRGNVFVCDDGDGFKVAKVRK